MRHTRQERRGSDKRPASDDKHQHSHQSRKRKQPDDSSDSRLKDKSFKRHCHKEEVTVWQSTLATRDL